MNAASEGHHAGRIGNDTHSIGLRIDLPIENKEAIHLDIKKEFQRFSNRLDNFILLSNVVVVASGGVGTLLELFYTWQLMQVKQICNTPIILMGDILTDFIDWIRRRLLDNRLIDHRDIHLLFLSENCSETFEIIKKAYEGYRKGDKDFCLKRAR